MKKTLILLFAIFTLQTLSAQINEGTTLLGGRLGQLSYDAKFKVLTFELDVTVANFINNTLMMGGLIGVQHASNSAATDVTSFIVGPMLREYITQTSFGGFFIEESVTMNITSYSGSTVNAFNFQFAPGYSFLLNKNLMLDLSLGAYYLASKQSSYGFNFNVGLGGLFNGG